MSNDYLVRSTTRGLRAEDIAGGGAPYSVIDAPLDTGQGWTIVAPSSGTAGTAAATFVGSGVARFTMTSVTDSTVEGLTGPRVERAITWGGGCRWRVRVSTVAAVGPVAFGALSFAALYLRNSSGSASYLVRLNSANTVVDTPGGGPGAGLTWGGPGTLELHVSEDGKVGVGFLDDTGLWHALVPLNDTNLSFVPTHVGVAGICGGTSSGWVEVRDLIVETFGAGTDSAGGGGVSLSDVDARIAAAVVAYLLAGAGLPLLLAPTAPLAGDGAEHHTALALPALVTPVDGRKYGLGGALTILDGSTGHADSGLVVCTMNFRDVVLLRAGGAWTLEGAGDFTVSAGSLTSNTLADYFVTRATDLPVFGDAAGALALFYTVASGQLVTLTLAAVLRDLGPNT